MSNKQKVLTIAGTRPELIRLSEIIKKFNIFFNHKLIFTNQNFSKELSSYFIKNFDIKIDYNLKIKNKSPSSSIAEIFTKFEKVLDIEKPDACFVLGDTNSALSAIVAKKKKIPIFHYEAGNRCFDERVPEEVNRKILDHLSDINLTYSNSAKQNLLNEGIALKNVFKIGSPLYEVFNSNKSKIDNSKILNKLELKKFDYFVASIHREENLENANKIHFLFEFLNKIIKKYNKKIIFSTHPRTLKILKKNKIKLDSKIIISKPLDYFDYCKLQRNSIFVFSDSGSISEEAYIMNFKALNLRDTHERHEAMEITSAPMISFLKNTNLKFVENLIRNKKVLNKLEEYEVENVSTIVTNIVSSYIENINTFKYLK